MVNKDKTSHNLDEVVSDLSKLLELSQDAATRLKQEIPGEQFPAAYELSKSIENLQRLVKNLQMSQDETLMMDLNDISMLQRPNLISSGDSFIG